MYDPRPIEIAWYKKFGHYPERVIDDSEGYKYVIGDRSWNAQNPGKIEYIERRIKQSELERC